MHNMFKIKKFLAVGLLTAPLVAFAQQPRAAYGPVQALRADHSTLTVVGQTFSLTSATKVAINGRPLSVELAFRFVTNDQLVYVEGRDIAGHSVATSIDFSRTRYTPGASVVSALGAIDEISATEGRVRIGSLWVDVTSVDPAVTSALQVGSLTQVSGVQPLLGGVVVGPVQLSVGGSGRSTSSVGGSGAAKTSVGGSGSTKTSVGGSGRSTASVGGSGVRTSSVGGSGVSLLSVGGSGASKASVGGSGSSKTSVGGSGRSTASVGGSGVRTSSVGGSGVSLLSVGGSGASKTSVGGSGKSIDSVGGSGVKALSVGGSGSRK
jgi:hypothetical protein